MRRFTREKWDGRKTLKVRRAFKGAGRSFKPGDNFEWARYGVEPRRVRQLYEAGFLDHDDAPVFVAQPGAKRWSIEARVEPQSEQTPEPEPEPQPEPEPEPTPQPEPPPSPRMVTNYDEAEAERVYLSGLKRDELWGIADEEGAPRKLKSADQVEAIIQNRAETNHGTIDA